jgi:hypothetical protein
MMNMIWSTNTKHPAMLHSHKTTNSSKPRKASPISDPVPKMLTLHSRNLLLMSILYMYVSHSCLSPLDLMTWHNQKLEFSSTWKMSDEAPTCACALLDKASLEITRGTLFSTSNSDSVSISRNIPESYLLFDACRGLMCTYPTPTHFLTPTRAYSFYELNCAY